MAEIEISEGYPFKEGYILDLQFVFLDLYRLLTIFGASKTLSKMAELHGGDPISELMSPEIDEIKRILINASVTARIVDERENFIISKEKFCGELITDLSNPNQVVGLNLREACNKIIHATKIRTDLGRENEKPFLLPKLYFYGKRGQQEWKASLNVYEFASIYYGVFKSA